MHILSTILTLFLALTTLCVAREVTRPGDWTTTPGVGVQDTTSPLHKLLKYKRDDPLPNLESFDQNVPDRRIKHVEEIPIIRKATGSCECGPAICPRDRMLETLIQDCEDAHAWGCWRKNPACAKPK